MMNSIIPEHFHPSWRKFMTAMRILQLQEIEREMGEDFNPEPQNVLRFLQNDLHKISVIITSQDPYFQPGIPTGRCFEVGGLNSWLTPFSQASLRNIVRLLWKTYNHVSEYDEIKTFAGIRDEIRNGEFNILPPNELFQSWEKQGVLLLNTTLTVEAWKPNSHKEYWQAFSSALIQYIAEENPDIKWFLWGREAQKLKECAPLKNIFECRHPSRVDGHNVDDFLRSDCFKKTMNEINWLG